MIRVLETRSEVSLPVDENDVLFDDTTGAYDYRPGNGEYGRLWMHNSALFDISKSLAFQSTYKSTRTDSNVSFQLDILADDGFRVYCELITAGSLMRIGDDVSSARTAHMGGIRLYFGR